MVVQDSTVALFVLVSWFIGVIMGYAIKEDEIKQEKSKQNIHENKTNG